MLFSWWGRGGGGVKIWFGGWEVSCGEFFLGVGEEQIGG